MRAAIYARGGPRVWLEGQVLMDAGLPHGTPYDIFIEPGKMTIWAVPEGRRRVSGKPERPIIDINTNKLNRVGDIGAPLKIFNPQPGTLILVVKVPRVLRTPEMEIECDTGFTSTLSKMPTGGSSSTPIVSPNVSRSTTDSENTSSNS